MPGELHCSGTGAIVVTILGSCVAVCLWDEMRGNGGMNHFVLPSDPSGNDSARYGNVAMTELESGLRRLGSRVADLRAKVFGGAAVLPFAGNSVGAANVHFALERLGQLQIQVIARRTGGTIGQQVKFNTSSGEVLFRTISGKRAAERWAEI